MGVSRKNPNLTPDQVRVLKANTDFIWSNAAEPHAERKARILKKHGKEINKLMGYEWKTKYVALSVAALQLFTAIVVIAGHRIQLPNVIQSYLATAPQLSSIVQLFLAPAPGDGLVAQFLLLVRGTTFASWAAYIALAYVLGGTLQHNLFLAIHEITHNLAFRRPLHNDILSIFCNLPIGVPYSMMFKTYHAEHHRYQGWDGIDTDVPSDIETKLFRTTIGKVFFAFFQILFYALRPCFLRQQTLHRMHALNWLVVVSFWVGLVGAGLGWAALGTAWIYCVLCTFFAGALHPMSGHFISEHYVFDPEGVQETYSYYGPLNILGYNVGLHNEHHDFPNVPWTRLHEVANIAPEYYDHLVVTDSWPKTIWNFITDNRVTTFSRVKREKDAWKRGNLMPTTTELAPAAYPRGEVPAQAKKASSPAKKSPSPSRKAPSPAPKKAKAASPKKAKAKAPSPPSAAKSRRAVSVPKTKKK